MDSAEINTGASSGSVTGNSRSGGTHLYDAVYLAAHDKLRQEAGRKILVLLTDGGEQGSEETLKSATEAAQKANAIIYVILIADRGFYSGGGFGIYTGDADMERLAKDTGGRVINVGNNGKKLEEAFDQIQDELRTQYLASYTSTNPKVNDGTFRTLNLTCQPGQKVQARKGYYAMADSQGKDD
jgi:VWFA-related protein